MSTQGNIKLMKAYSDLELVIKLPIIGRFDLWGKVWNLISAQKVDVKSHEAYEVSKKGFAKWHEKEKDSHFYKATNFG